MISIDAAIQLVERHAVETNDLVMPLKDSVNFYLSQDLFSPIDMPPFRQSVMDGYALRISDTKVYKLIAEVKAGDAHQPQLQRGEAVRIFTGAAVPDSADAVIMQEQVSVENNAVTILKDLLPGMHIRPKGEQVKAKALAFKKGAKLTPGAIGFLASLGIAEVPVYRKPKIAIVVTGNELIQHHEVLEHGKIYESNGIMLASALTAQGFTDFELYNVKDDYKQTYQVIDRLIKSHDLLIINGGISVGDYDFVGQALGDLKVEALFYKVKQKPGKPLFFGKKENCLVFALPGNPAAALTCYYMYVLPAVKRMIGDANFALKRSKKKTETAFLKKGARPQFLKARLEGEVVTILDGQSSSMQQTFALANALVFMPEAVEKISKGDMVEVIHLPEL